jgi:tetratricopeptide (TPR) repeat protein
MKRCLFILSILFICAGTLVASDVTMNFSAANQLYAEGKFPDAARSYGVILNSGAASPNLLFNDGNAEFKAGNLGRAIAAYRRAALLAPRDADVRANLEFARNQVQGTTLRESHWQGLIGVLTLNEWATLAMIAFWLAFILFSAMQIRPALKGGLRGLARCTAAAAIFCCVCLGTITHIHSESIAVVILPDAVTRVGPFDDAQNAFAVHDGAELAILDERIGWVQVGDGTGRTGWMQSAQVELLPPI